MYARVWRAGILSGKVDGFTASIDSMKPLLRAQPGFCGLLVLHSGPGEALEATIVSMWTSIDALRDSETPEYQKAVAHVVSFCAGHPVMREEEVLLMDIVSGDPDKTVTHL